MTKLRMLSILFLLAFACAMLAPTLTSYWELQASGNTGDVCEDCDTDPEYEGERGK